MDTSDLMVILNAVPGIYVGQHFANRRELHDANVHRGLMRGIAPRGSSIVLSGGYADDVDQGEIVIYTGEGGRDPNSGAQIENQELTGGNFALAHNSVEGIAVRVNRGSGLDSEYAPESGYRYDGLYRVQQYWTEQGSHGFTICRYRLERLADQPSLGETAAGHAVAGVEVAPVIGSNQPPRSHSIVSRIIRSTAIGNEVKRIYDHKCQVCGVRLVTPVGAYAECCHIKPLGEPHNGPDTLDNVLCLCPNCHVLFDAYAIVIEETLNIRGAVRSLTVLHNINRAHFEYHRSLAGESEKSLAE